MNGLVDGLGELIVHLSGLHLTLKGGVVPKRSSAGANLVDKLTSGSAAVNQPSTPALIHGHSTPATNKSKGRAPRASEPLPQQPISLIDGMTSSKTGMVN